MKNKINELIQHCIDRKNNHISILKEDYKYRDDEKEVTELIVIDHRTNKNIIKLTRSFGGYLGEEYSVEVFGQYISSNLIHVRGIYDILNDNKKNNVELNLKREIDKFINE